MKVVEPHTKGEAQIPEAFLIKMQELLGNEYQAFSKSLSEPSIAGLRVNPLKISPREFQERYGPNLTSVSWCPTGFILPLGMDTNKASSPGKHPDHAAGLYYLQEPTAMAPVEILDPQPGERVLDLAAAPGGKTTQIVSRMENTGLVIANEIHPQRVWALAENLERWGARNTIILNETPARLADKFNAYFDRVLLDAPCSGEGMFRKSSAARYDWSIELVERCSARQTILLDNAAEMLRPGGTIVYSTCTYAPQENEAVIAGFLKTHPEFELVETRLDPTFKSGRPDWLDLVQPEIALQLVKTLRLWPHLLTGDGHFVARLKRHGDSPDKRSPSRPKSNIPAEFLTVFRDFCKNTLLPTLSLEPLSIQGSYLYQIIPDSPDLTGLHVIHPGWWLGVYKQSRRGGTLRFEPAHALALGLRSHQAQQSNALDHQTAVQYLRGASLSSPGPDGWVLVCADEFPLGWGKRIDGTIKNNYPKGLRWV